MADGPLFSVIVTNPTGGEVEDSLKSVHRQSLPDEEYEIILVEQPANHWGEARNHGLPQAQGRYVAFLDAGDSWRSDALEMARKIIRHAPAELIYTEIKALDVWGELWPTAYDSPRGNLSAASGEVLRGLRPFAGHPGGIFYEREFLRRTGLAFTSPWPDDPLWALRCAGEATNVLALEEYLYYRAQEPVIMAPERLEGFLAAWAEVRRWLEGSGQWETRRPEWGEGLRRQLRFAVLILKDRRDDLDRLRFKAAESDILGPEDAGSFFEDALLEARPRALWPSVELENLCQAAAGAVVMVASVDYVVRHFAAIARRLAGLGIKSVLCDLSGNFFPLRCVRPPEEAASFSDLNYFQVDLASIQPLFLNARAYLLAADWDVFRPLVFQLKERKIPTIAFYEGIHDDNRVDMPEANLPYRHTDVLLLPGEYYRPIYSGQKTYVTGLPVLRALRQEEPRFPEEILVVINLNFSYGILEHGRATFLETAVEACRALGLSFVINQHPVDLADLSGLPRSSRPIYDDLRRGSILISRFSTCIMEALALGKPVIYHNPHGEKTPKFSDDPMGAYQLTDSRDTLIAALESVLRDLAEGVNVRRRAEPWLQHHSNIFAEQPPELYAARAVREVVEADEECFQKRVLHLAGQGPWRQMPPVPPPPEALATLKLMGLPIASVDQQFVPPNILTPDPAAYPGPPPDEAVFPPELAAFYRAWPEPRDRETVVEALKVEAARALAGGEGRQAHRWLDEYELYQGRDDQARELEAKLEVWRQEHGLRSLFPSRPDGGEMALNLVDLKNKFAGQRAFVVGNGPSLRRMKLDRLKNEVTLGVNSIFMMGLTPTFHLADETYAATEWPGTARLARLSGPIKVYGPELAPWLGVDGETIFPHLIPDPGSRGGEPYFSVDAAARLWPGGSPPYLSLQLAYYLGFSEVFLIGFDHTLPPSAKVTAMEAGYRKAKRAFKLADRRIFNATPGGRLEIFERVNFEEIFETGQPAKIEGRLGADWLAGWRQTAKDKLVARRKQRPAPEVAVIVPVYNVEAYVHKALTSIMNQTFEDMEIIVVDQSDDTGPEIIRKLAGEDPRIRVLRQDEKSPGLARNRGLAVSSAPWVIFVDADDFVEPDLVESLWRKATEEGLDLVNGLRSINEDGVDRYEVFNMGVYQHPQEAVRDLLRGGHSGVGWGRLYRRKLFTEHGLAFPDGLFEDLALVYRLYLAADRVGTVNRSLYHWRRRPGSSTFSLGREHVTDLFVVLDSRFHVLHSTLELWAEYENDYYQGLWHFLNWLLVKLGDDELLIREFIQNAVARNLHEPSMVSRITDERLRARLTAVLKPVQVLGDRTSTDVIKVYYWYDPLYHIKANAGDLLSAYLVHHITGKKICQARARETGKLLGIGSILKMALEDDSIVWGSGIMEPHMLPMKKNVSFIAVRGPLTRQYVMASGYVCPELYGDPALLTPYFYSPKVDKKHKLGLVLHYKHRNLNFDHDLKIIHTLTEHTSSGVESFLDQILECEHIMSSSLHGVILAHAYGIPAQWVYFPEQLIRATHWDFKFKDYYASIGQTEKEPLALSINSRLRASDLLKKVDKTVNIPLDLKKLRDSFPFDENSRILHSKLKC